MNNFWTIVGGCESLIAIIAAFISGFKWLYKRFPSRCSVLNKNEYLAKRYELIYVPLRKLFLDCHMLGSQAVRYPYLTQRIKNAWWYFKRLKFKNGFRAIMDKGIFESAEFEYGGVFPIAAINNIIKTNMQYADAKLVSLVQTASRAGYEQQRSYENELLPEEIKLYRHITRNHEKLSK